MKNVMLLVHDDAGQESRLQAALDLTRALQGHLTCIDAVPVPVIIDGLAGAGMAMVLEDERTREAENRTRVEPRLAKEDVSWSWVETTGDLAACLVDAARTGDLLVLNRQLDEYPAPDMRYIVGEVLSRSRTLIVAVPDSSRGFKPFGKALIAWDGSERAMATLKRATPLVALASDVKLYQLGETDRDAIPLAQAAAYLSRHGIKADTEQVPETVSVAAAIRLEAEMFGASYIVMGAYSHSRTREAIFGGVTRAMLTSCSLPIVLGH